MKKCTYVLFISAILVLALSFIIAGSSYAVEKKAQQTAKQQTAQQQPQQENKVIKFFKSLIIWPFGITKEAAVTVGRTAKSGIETGTKTATSSVEMVTGKPEKIKDVIVEPVKGSVETGYTAVEGSVMTPVRGTEDAFGSKEEPQKQSE